MFFTTINQGNVFLVFLYAGLIVGVLVYVSSIFLAKLHPIQDKTTLISHLTSKAKNTIKSKLTKMQIFNNIVYHIVLCIQVILYVALFGLLTYFFNFGELRAFCVIGYVLGISISFFNIKYLLKYIKLHKLKKILKSSTK